MTAVKVVDASAIGAVLFGEPAADAIAERLEGEHLAAPALLPFEVANVAVKKIRRYPEAREALVAAVALFPRFAIDLVAVNHEHVVELAETSNLTAYDASYLWLARKLDADLVTLDKALARASNLS